MSYIAVAHSLPRCILTTPCPYQCCNVYFSAEWKLEEGTSVFYIYSWALWPPGPPLSIPSKARTHSTRCSSSQ